MALPTPLLAAVYRRDEVEVGRLLATGAPPTLYEAAALGDAARIRTPGRTTPAAVAERSPNGWPPLRRAAHFGHAEAVEARLEARAAFHDDVGVVEALLVRGALVDAREDGGRTPLAIAEAQGRTRAARRLRGEMP